MLIYLTAFSLDLIMPIRKCFGFLIPDELLQELGKKYHEEHHPDFILPERAVHGAYGSIGSTELIGKVQGLPWALTRMATVSTCGGGIERVVSLFDNFSNEFGKLGSARRPGPKQLTPEIIEQFQKALGVTTPPRAFYMYDQY
jgi:hypothetical protein